MSELNHLWKKLSCSQSSSLLKIHLNTEKLENLKSKRTKYGGTINDCIRVGCKYPNISIGIYACDQNAYTTFAEIFEPIIKAYHNMTAFTHPSADYGDPNLLNLFALESTKDKVISSNINVSRNFDGYRYHPILTKGDRLEIEKLAVEALTNLEGDLMGRYFSYVGISPEDRKHLINENIYFDNSNRLKKAAGCYDDWPAGRGVYYNLDKNLVCWVNEEDHLRIFCSEKGPRLADAYKKLVRMMQSLEKKVMFAQGTFGYLNFCCSNLGIAMTISLIVKLPRPNLKPDSLEICKKYCLECKPIQNMSSYWICEIINKRVIGTTEFETVNSVAMGTVRILNIEDDNK
ncbi:arginine kinase-like [Octopus vulgaris]|uniref:Arginine kinase-like n=2 Tax=Octopus TaxID=6643 RepID=A0AA36B1G3_OCTVU|nr:arginine kinase Oct f 2-like [Octopus sinensis]CAI9726195.1 arginine kinase-like [Octopus vulgaris]